ncbi:MAG: penicillin-binding protein 1C [bacterium]|nr:penicillin-binding protein 1C [bacterium]
MIKRKIKEFIGTVWRWKAVKLLVTLAVAVICFEVLLYVSLAVYPLPVFKLEEDFSTVHLSSENELLRINLSPTGKYRVKLKLEDISEYLKKGFLFYEDRYFYRHKGINPISLCRALATNIKYQKKLGASTITMQIAKMIEPKPRTIKAKLLEMVRALQLEKKYSKQELLEMYLNSVPMGGNIEGVGAAAYLYFNKPASQLSLGESALLIALPKSPTANRPDISPVKAKKQRNKVLDRIGVQLAQYSDMIAGAREERIPAKREENPFKAPSLIVRAAGGPEFIKTYCISMPLQAYGEELIAKSVKRLSIRGCYNGALIIIDNRTMKVLAYVGTADFNDALHGGQINCANIKRSPGSLLKTFLYAQGVEEGKITPKKILYDIERHYEGYNPANFDKKFTGLVTAEEALIDSLNVPAVNLEYELGKKGLRDFLQRARLMDRSRNKLNPGLSIVLGAYPLTLEELVKLYASMANNGKMRELVFLENDLSKNEGVQILSPEACFIITSCLAKIQRTDLPRAWEFTPTRGRIAFKTGTSFGLKDAWCIGYNPDYTVGVWLGNTDAKGSTALVGIRATAPILVEVFNYLTRYHDSWFQKPGQVEERLICALSGEVAGPYCQNTLTDYYIPGISNNSVCAVHQKIQVRKKDGKEVCRYCMDGLPGEYKDKVIEIWPPDVASFLRKNGRKVATTPEHNTTCTVFASAKELKIESPLPNSHYVFNPALPAGSQKIELTAQSVNPGTEVYWYVDDCLLARGSPDKMVLMQPAIGEHKITVMNARGAYDTVSINVQKEN